MLHIRRWSLRVRLAGAAAITAGIGLILSTTPAQAATANFIAFPAGPCSGQFLNDIAAGANGAVWVISSSNTCQVAGPSSGHGVFNIGGKRLGVAPNGLPWIVTFSGQIIRMNADGSTTTMPGAANDIAIGPAGGVWAIGTNSVSGGFGVWEWNGSSWVTPPGGGSGEEIDVASDNQPIVDNSGLHIFARSSNGSWGEYTGLANDIAVGADGSSSGTPGEPGGSPLWVIGNNSFNNGFAVWNFLNGIWQQSQFGASQIAVDSGGTPWVTSGGGLYEG